MSDLIAKIPNLRGGTLNISRDGETMIIGGRQLDLDGIAALVEACDDTVREIRRAQVNKAAAGG